VATALELLRQALAEGHVPNVAFIASRLKRQRRLDARECDSKRGSKRDSMRASSQEPGNLEAVQPEVELKLEAKLEPVQLARGKQAERSQTHTSGGGAGAGDAATSTTGSTTASTPPPAASLRTRRCPAEGGEISSRGGALSLFPICMYPPPHTSEGGEITFSSSALAAASKGPPIDEQGAPRVRGAPHRKTLEVPYMPCIGARGVM